VYGSCKEEYGRVKGTGASCSPPLHSSVREDYRSFWFAVYGCFVKSLTKDMVQFAFHVPLSHTNMKGYMMLTNKLWRSVI
jgi:hypothetical protein